MKNKWYTPAELLPDFEQHVWLKMKKKYIGGDDYDTHEYEVYVVAKYSNGDGFAHNEKDPALIVTHWQKIDAPEKVK